MTPQPDRVEALTPRLRAAGVSWRAGAVTILHDVSVAIGAGEFVALMGRNGAGKSTLLDLMAGLRQPSAGSIEVEGRRHDEWPARDRALAIAHLPQTVRPDMAMTVEQLVAMGRYPHAIAWAESPSDRLVIEEALTRCECQEFRGRRVGTLSGGERQRVLIAACLAQAPRLLLLDEPATFLDIDHQLQCFGLLRDEAERGTACVAVTHDINLALTFCTRILVLSEGTLVRDLDAAAALGDAPDWLRLFSPRLGVTSTPAGRPWVCFA